jgi:hypothetical protein
MLTLISWRLSVKARTESVNSPENTWAAVLTGIDREPYIEVRITGGTGVVGIAAREKQLDRALSRDPRREVGTAVRSDPAGAAP